MRVKKRHQEKYKVLDKIHICVPVAKLPKRTEIFKKDKVFAMIYARFFFSTPLNMEHVARL